MAASKVVNQINGTSGDNIVQRGSVWHISCAPGQVIKGSFGHVASEKPFKALQRPKIKPW